MTGAVIVTLLVILIVGSLLVYLIDTAPNPPFTPPIKWAIRALIVVLIILWLLNLIYPGHLFVVR